METTETTLADVVGGVKAKRKPAVSQAQFLAALKAGSDATPKLTAQQVAEKLDMGKGSFDQRHNQYRMNWRAYAVVILHKQNATLAEINEHTGAGYTPESLEKLLTSLKADGTYAGTAIDDAFLTTKVGEKYVPKPFPWTLADGRSDGNGGGGRKVDTTRNAIFAAMMGVDAKSELPESTDESDESEPPAE